MMWTVGSLFAGIGGLDLGFERCGFEIAWQVEIDPFCRAVLARHWPNVPRYGDIRECGVQNLPSVDILIGGFPCKQTSRAAAIHRRRTGLNGSDSGLWKEMLRIVREMRPRVVLVENPASPWLSEVSHDLAGAGYNVPKPRCVSAASIGAPHLRRRMFIVAYADGTRLASAWLSESSETDSQSWGTSNRNAWLLSLAGVYRVADGLSSGLDGRARTRSNRRARLTALGNAVVPAVAEVVAQRVRDYLVLLGGDHD